MVKVFLALISGLSVFPESQGTHCSYMVYISAPDTVWFHLSYCKLNMARG